jgi:hypothetical protein
MFIGKKDRKAFFPLFSVILYGGIALKQGRNDPT